MNTIKNESIIGFEYLRVLACIMVVWLHVSYTNVFLSTNRTITHIAVPVFIMMSIFLLGYKTKMSFTDVAKNIAFRIAPQYCFWTFLYLILYVAKGYVSNQPIDINFSKLFLGGSAVQLWYLPALLIWYLSAYFLYKIESFWFDILAFVVFFILARYLLSEEYSIKEHFVRLFIENTPYIIIAKMAFKNQSIIKNFRSSILLCLVCLFSFSIYIFKEDKILYPVFLCFCSIFIFLVFYKLKTTQNSIIKNLSKLSFGVYLVHFGVYQIIILIENVVSINNTNLTITLANIISTSSISFFISFVFSKFNYFPKVATLC